MFGIDFSEILVIFGIALVVLGPEKLPRLARTVGRWVGRARAMARQFREQLEQEADALHRSADLRTSQPQPPPPATAAASPTPPPVVSIVPDCRADHWHRRHRCRRHRHPRPSAATGDAGGGTA
jgi:Tat protein translocase TatB subunit